MGSSGDGSEAALIDEAERRVRSQLAGLQKETAKLKRREAALQIQLAHATLENVELRREVAAGWQAAEPSVLQVRQLVTDPAVQREFDRLRAEHHNSGVQVQQLKEQLNAREYTQVRGPSLRFLVAPRFATLIRLALQSLHRAA